jgi:hypothetical protein
VHQNRLSQALTARLVVAFKMADSFGKGLHFKPKIIEFLEASPTRGACFPSDFRKGA